MRDPTVSLFRFASGHTVDPAAAVKDHEPSRKAVAEPGASGNFGAAWCEPRSCWRGRRPRERLSRALASMLLQPVNSAILALQMFCVTRGSPEGSGRKPPGRFG
jgi:hypothetical protein